MKKCSCGFKTSNKEFNICPICGKKLENDNGKRKFLMTLSAEDIYSKEIEMTYEEAKIVNRVLDELNEDSEGYCGSCWINIG